MFDPKTDSPSQSAEKPSAVGRQAPSRRGPHAVRLSVAFVVLLLGLGLIATAWKLATPPREVATKDVATFYHDDLSPLVEAASARNRAAALRALELLHARLNVHRAGIRPFVDDVGGWSTRFGVLGCYAVDWWSSWAGDANDSRVQSYIQEKFRSRVLSAQSLRADLDEVLTQFQEEVQASGNRLYSKIKVPLSGSRSPITLDDQRWDKICKQISTRADQVIATTAGDSVATGIAGLGGGTLATWATEEIVTQILARVGATLAASTAGTAALAGGGATLGSAAAGGEAGSFGGPAGTVVGVGLGLAVGAVVDWWLTDQFEAEVTIECNDFLDHVEQQLIEGDGQSPGLRASFEQAIRLAEEAKRQAIMSSLSEAIQ